MNILIVGGTGLISNAITRMLLERGDTVTLYNRGKSEAYFPAGACQMIGDRKNYAEFEAQMQEKSRFDCVIDMICYTPEDAESLARAFRGRADHLIFCSTVDVYTKPATRYPYREDEPLSGIGTYATDKVKCEHILMDAHQRGDFPLTIIRPAYTYGEGRGLIHSLGGGTMYIDRIRRGKPIIVHGDGSSFWTACHRDDVAAAFVETAGKSKTFGKSYHTTGEEWMTWNRYHQTVAEALGAPVPALVHIPTDLLVRITPKRAKVTFENFQYNNIFDNTAAHTDLNFRYSIPWSTGVRRIVAWLDERNMIQNSDDDPSDDTIITAWQRLVSNMAQEE